LIVATFNIQLPEIAPPPVVFLPPEVRKADELWPLAGTPEPDLRSRGMTEALCVVEYFYGSTTAKKLDGLLHLANICTKKVGGGYWSPRPYLKFTHARTANLDWENCDPNFPFLQKVTTRRWFTIQIPGHIDRYSPRHITKRELLELARLRDKDLLHVCHALVCDMFNEAQKERLHEVSSSTLWEEDGQAFYWDERREVAVQPSVAPSVRQDYTGAVEMLVKDKKLRDTLPPLVCRTLEMVFRKLAAGVDPKDVVAAVAKDLRRKQRTVRRHLSISRRAADDLSSVSSKVMNLLASHVLPATTQIVAQATPFRSEVDAEPGALQSQFAT
jgi:hypothetical protein